MSNAAHPNLLRRLMGQKPPVAPEVDPADMGTAMGLDYCLDEPPAEVAAAAQNSAAQTHWLRRLSAS
jgi:hypothetical protein